MYQKKSKGIEMLRLVAGKAIAKNRHISLSPQELIELLNEIDQIKPRQNKPKHKKEKRMD
jgi:hypothetical protein